MMMPGRKFSAGTGYRYGFNGKENDNDVKGEGNQQDYGMRIYDPRIGKFLSVDPISSEYPELTPYQFAANRPIDGIDIDGREWGRYYAFRMASTKPAPSQSNQQTTNSSPSTQQGVVHRGFWSRIGSISSAGVNGTRDGISDMTQTFSTSSLKSAGSNFLGTLKDIGGMAIGDEESIRSFNQRAYNASMAVANPIVEPVKFLSTMTTRSLEENAYGIGYFGSQTLITYGMDRFVGGIENSPVSFHLGVETPWGRALQSTSTESLAALSNVKNGATLYRIGATGISKTGIEAQFWALENPLINPEAFAKKYGIPIENIKNADFLETATLKPGSNVVTRKAPEAPGSASGSGGGIEAVVEIGGTSGNKITPLKK